VAALTLYCCMSRHESRHKTRWTVSYVPKAKKADSVISRVFD